jgi:hypothetical protein
MQAMCIADEQTSSCWPCGRHNWVFRDESCHLEFAFEVVNVVRTQEPDLWDAKLEQDVVIMLREVVEAETQFAEDLLSIRGLRRGCLPRGFLEQFSETEPYGSAR